MLRALDMGKIIAKLNDFFGEYFLGSKSRRDYRDLRSFEREFRLSDLYLREVIRGSKFIEESYILVGKIVPNIVTAGAVAYATYSKNTEWFEVATVSEIFRILFQLRTRAELNQGISSKTDTISAYSRRDELSELERENDESLRGILEGTDRIDERINELIREFDEDLEGEDWKYS